MTIKVSDLAKELEVSVDEILDQMRRLFVDAEDESSKVDEKIAALVRHKFGGAKPKKPAKKPAAPKAAAKPKKTAKKEAVKSGESAKTDISSEKKLTVDETPEKNLEKIKAAKDILEGVKTEEIKLPEPVDIPKPSDSPKVQGIRIIRHAEPEALKSEPKIKEDMPKPKLLKPKGKKGGFNDERFSPIEVLEIKDDVEGEDGLMGKPGVKRPGAYRKAGKKTSFYKPKSHVDAASVTEDKLPASKTPQKVEMEVPVSVRSLSMKINKKPNEVLRYVIGKGQLITINQDIEEELARDILTNFGYELEIPKSISTMEKELSEEHHEADKVPLVPRAPIVTFMGHVDHGKTSLLDYIRNTLVAKKEKGGITQHIGAYKVETSKGSVTFLDTPGHEAFTAMRARGANATDVVVLVVAADDGVMPQTKEAIDHARAAGVPIVVAINKCDLANGSPDRVKRELQQEDLAPEDWGGKTVMVPVSAKTGEGMDQLVEMLMLESELLDLKANPSIRARGVVIESKKTS
ncbi:MAG: GTP-binding protein, partial [Candidatus Omnitrophica bacterium]|nr:GTP-binding protein [Candidatus Omnitrophota bacterium]